MAKRELSSTLRSLKFMQRASQKEELPKKVEPVISGNRKCIVIMEGDPPPEAVTGRMSFQDFNPAIQKLISGAEGDVEQAVPSSSDTQGNVGRIDRSKMSLDRKEIFEEDSSDSDAIPRKKLKADKDTGSSNLIQNMRQMPSAQRRKNQQERPKLDWKLLRPPTGRR